MKSLLVPLMVLVGAGLSLQAPINARLRDVLGSPALTALVSFLVGTAALALVTLSGYFGEGRLAQLPRASWWMWLGGLIGAIYVTMAMIAVPRIGTAAVIAAAILGQLVAALAIDANGWFGIPRVPVTLTRACGAILLFAGVLLLQRRE